MRRVPDTPLWAPDVEAYEMVEGGKVIGRFYMDNHPRDGKYTHANVIPIRAGLTDRQVPIGLVFDVERATATRQALRTGRPARADHAELPHDDETIRDLGIRSAIAAPIDVPGRRWGVVRAARAGHEPLALGKRRNPGTHLGVVFRNAIRGLARRGSPLED